MGRLSRAWVVAVLVGALSVTSVVRAAPASGTKICIGDLDIRGLKARAKRATRKAVTRHLRKLGVVVPDDTRNLSIEGDCLADPDCVVWALEDVSVDGVLTVEVVKKRRKVRVRVRYYHASNGKKAFEDTIEVKARRFPKRAPIGPLLARGLKALQSGEVWTKPVPEPKPQPAVAQTPAAATPTPAASAVAPSSTSTPRAEAPSASTRDPSGPAPSASTPTGQGLSMWTALGASGLGLGVIVAVVGTTTGLLALQLNDALMAQCDQSSMTCAHDRGDDYEQMRGLAFATDLLLGTGVVIMLAGAGAIVYGFVDGGE